MIPTSDFYNLGWLLLNTDWIRIYLSSCAPNSVVSGRNPSFYPPKTQSTEVCLQKSRPFSPPIRFARGCSELGFSDSGWAEVRDLPNPGVPGAAQCERTLHQPCRHICSHSEAEGIVALGDFLYIAGRSR